jgi:hypothetical protein
MAQVQEFGNSQVKNIGVVGFEVLTAGGMRSSGI